MNELILRSLRYSLTSLLFGALTFAPSVLHAQEEDEGGGGAAAVPWPGFTIHGFVSASYSYNFNSPPSGLNAFRIFDFDDNEFKPDVAQIVFQKEVRGSNSAGFRVDLAAGASIPRITASPGLFRDADGKAGDIDLQQAYVSYMAPIGEGLQIDLGKFVTWAGYEVIDGWEDYNKNATRSFLFGYAIPFSHTGLRLTYKFSPEFAAAAMVANGWDVVKDNNESKTVGLRLGLAPDPDLVFALTYLGGAERDDNDSDMRHLLDLVAAWQASERVSIGANADYGMDADLVGPGKNAIWQGVAGYLRFGLSDDFSLAIRGEVFDDRDGTRTGIRQTLKELTLTPQFIATRNLSFRADLRMDFSNNSVFPKDSGSTNTQPTLMINGVYAF